MTNRKDCVTNPVTGDLSLPCEEQKRLHQEDSVASKRRRDRFTSAALDEALALAGGVEWAQVSLVIGRRCWVVTVALGIGVGVVVGVRVGVGGIPCHRFVAQALQVSACINANELPR